MTAPPHHGPPPAPAGRALPRRLALVAEQERIDLVTPRTDLRQRLPCARIAELGRLGAQHLANYFPRQAEFPADRLDRLLLNEIRPPDLRDRLHYQHPWPHVPHGGHLAIRYCA